MMENYKKNKKWIKKNNYLNNKKPRVQVREKPNNFKSSY